MDANDHPRQRAPPAEAHSSALGGLLASGLGVRLEGQRLPTRPMPRASGRPPSQPGSSRCILTPEQTEGPYYIANSRSSAATSGTATRASGSTCARRSSTPRRASPSRARSSRSGTATQPGSIPASAAGAVEPDVPPRRAAHGCEGPRPVHDHLSRLVPRPHRPHPRQGAHRRHRRPHGSALLQRHGDRRRLPQGSVPLPRRADDPERRRLDLPERRQPLAGAAREGRRNGGYVGTIAMGSQPLGTSTLTQPSSTRTGNVSTGSKAGRVRALPVVMSNRAPWRGQIATQSSGSHSPSASGPSSCEQRSSIAYSLPPQL